MKKGIIILFNLLLFLPSLWAFDPIGEIVEGNSWSQAFTQAWEDNPASGYIESVAKTHPFDRMTITKLEGINNFVVDINNNIKPFQVTNSKILPSGTANDWGEPNPTEESETFAAVIDKNIGTQTWFTYFTLYFTDGGAGEPPKNISFLFQTYYQDNLIETWYCGYNIRDFFKGGAVVPGWNIYKIRNYIPPGIQSSSIVLHLDPVYMKDNKPMELSPFDTWYDIAGLDKVGNTSPQDGDNAIMNDSKRQPTFVSNWYQRPNPSNTYLPGVRFTQDNNANKYGYSDIMSIEYDNENGDIITSTNDDKWNPQEDQTDKSLVVIFKPESPNGGPAYWSDGRQVLAEFGGPLSGFNIYINGGKLFFGMWNRFESRYASVDLPTAMPNILMAHLEYNADTKKFRGMLYYNSTRLISNLMDFKGITQDVDKLGIGGACRTRFADYSIGSTYSCEFNGVLGDVMVYNNLGDWQEVYYNLNTRYATTFYYPVSGSGSPRQSDEWNYYILNEAPEEAMQTEAYPNPFATETSFDLSLPEKDFVTVSLYDMQGKKVSDVYSGMLSSGRNQITINSNGLVSGVYLVRATGTNFSLNQKVVLVK